MKKLQNKEEYLVGGGPLRLGIKKVNFYQLPATRHNTPQKTKPSNEDEVSRVKDEVGKLNCTTKTKWAVTIAVNVVASFNIHAFWPHQVSSAEYTYMPKVPSQGLVLGTFIFCPRY